MRNRFGLEGKSVLITGAAQHLGFEIAKNLSKEGLRIGIADIQVEKGEQAAEQIRQEGGGEAYFFHVDLKSPESVSVMIDAVYKKFTELHLLVNNAKIDSKPPGEDNEIKHWNDSLQVILSGAYYCSRAVVPQMEERGGGVILNISSVASEFVTMESVGYHSAKAGIDQMTRYQAKWFGPKGIRVNAISPGFIIKRDHLSRFESDTEWKNRWEWCHPLRKAGNSCDLSNAILFLASDLSRFITGQNLTVDGGMTLSEPGGLVNDYAKTILDKS
tara:strand:+ start:69 stop:887 length:819 start_codon:yes stop_codon:yes gene_type:complete